MTIKIGRNSYDIVVGDKFLDNGACIQFMTQSKERVEWGHQPSPTLSKKAWKEILALPSYKKYKHATCNHCSIYEILEV